MPSRRWLTAADGLFTGCHFPFKFTKKEIFDRLCKQINTKFHGLWPQMLTFFGQSNFETVGGGFVETLPTGYFQKADRRALPVCWVVPNRAGANSMGGPVDWMR